MEDLAIERAVLAGVCKYGNEAFIDIADIIEIETFTDPFNQSLFKCLKKILESADKIDLASIFSCAKTLKLDDVIQKDIKLLRAILNFNTDLSNVRKFAAKVRKLQIGRDYLMTIEEIRRKLSQITGEESLTEILAIGENRIYEFCIKLNQAEEGPQKLGVGLTEYTKFLAENKRNMAGITTGYPNLDFAIGGGLRPGTVNLVGSRSKVGKTFFADNVAINIARLGVPVLELDTEMTKEDHWNRVLAKLSNVSIHDIENGAFDKNENWKKKVEQATEHLASLPYSYLSIVGREFDEVLSLLRRWILREVGLENSRTKPCVIIYDYLKLMNTNEFTKSLQEYQILGFQITKLHNFTVKYDFPCLAFVQLNRDGITKEDTDAVSGSDRLIWLCSNFSIFKPISEEEQADFPNWNRKLVPIVARHGEGLAYGDFILMNLEGKYGKLSEGPTRFNFNKANNPKGFESNGVAQF